jgi:hypothetical protein
MHLVSDPSSQTSMQVKENHMRMQQQLQLALANFAEVQGCPTPYSWAVEAGSILTTHLMKLCPPPNGLASRLDTKNFADDKDCR